MIEFSRLKQRMSVGLGRACGRCKSEEIQDSEVFEEKEKGKERNPGSWLLKNIKGESSKKAMFGKGIYFVLLGKTKITLPK